MIDLKEQGLDDLVRDLNLRLEQKQPGSFLRFNDGEGKVSGCPEYYPGVALCGELRTHFGNNPLTDTTFLSLRREMNAAFCNADWVGIPPSNWPVLFARARGVLEHAVFDESRPPPRFTHVSFPQLMLERRLFDPILRGRDFLGLVGCRDLRRFFQDNYDVQSVTFISVPEQGSAAYSGYLPPHYPKFAQTVVAGIKVPYPGALFLVGAGFCGKLYADAIKQQGGIAVDVGSLMDLWAGRFTRPYMNFEPIIAYYERLLDEGDSVPSTFHAMADYYKLNKDVRAEAAVLDRAITENPYVFDFHYRKVELLLRTGEKVTAAAHAWEHVVRRRFIGPEVFKIAKLFLVAEDRENGSNLLTLAFNLDPTYEPVLVELANFYMDPNYVAPPGVAFRFDEVMGRIAADTENAQLLSQYARVVGSRGRYGEAIEISDRAAEVFSYDSHLFNQKAGWEKLLGHTDKAAISTAQAKRLEAATLQ